MTPAVTEPGQVARRLRYTSKVPGVGAMIVCMVVLKGLLARFLATFPMVTTFALL